MIDGKPSGNWEIFADGFKGPKPLESPGDAIFRPCGLSEGPDGSLYIVDSNIGRVWRIMYYPDGIKNTVATETAVSPVESGTAETEPTVQ